MTKKKQNSTTLEDLAGMVKRGFDHVATKDDLKEFVTKDDLKGLATKDNFKNIIEEISAIRADVRDIKGTLGPLARVVNAQEHDLSNLRIRVARIEMKVGITK